MCMCVCVYIVETLYFVIVFVNLCQSHRPKLERGD